MKLVHSAATLSQVHSNIWIMTVFAVDGARVAKGVLSFALARKERPWIGAQRAPNVMVASQDQVRIGTLRATRAVEGRQRERVLIGLRKRELETNIVPRWYPKSDERR